jgi:chromosome segregation ATPase
MRVSEHANYLLNEYGRLQFDYAAYCKPNGESLRNEARNNLEEYIAELEAENDRLQSVWFVEETICPDGSLRPKVSALLSRLAELEAENERLSQLLHECKALEAENAELEAERRWIPVRLSKTLTLGAMAGVGVELTGADVEALVRTITGMGEEIRTLNARIAELEAHIAALEEVAGIEEWDDFPNFPEPPEVK